MIVALAQVSSQNSWQKNWARMQLWSALAAKESAELILFPENVFYMGDPKCAGRVAQELTAFKVIEQSKALAKRLSIAILIGGFPEFRKGTKKVWNTSVFIDQNGRELARYRKIHLFDVITPTGQRYTESAIFMAGKTLTTFRWKGIRIGLTICYDVRFPEQYRALARKGAEWIFVPSAFTRETGEAHWHTLLRARAIENFATIMAPAQTGRHPMGRKTFGHSLVIGPWGEILMDGQTAPGLKLVDVPRGESRKLRRKFSVA